MTTTDTTHQATIVPEIGGFLVTCPEGCNLGTSAHAPTRDKANSRVRLHALATTPLVTPATCKIRLAHVPHGMCPGTAPEYPSDRVITDLEPVYLPPSSRDRCGWCRVKATADAPIFPVLGTGESMHAGCIGQAEKHAGTEAQPIGADAEPGDLYGPAN